MDGGDRTISGFRLVQEDLAVPPAVAMADGSQKLCVSEWFSHACTQRKQPFDYLYFNNPAATHWFKSRGEWAEMLNDNSSISSVLSL